MTTKIHGNQILPGTINLNDLVSGVINGSFTNANITVSSGMIIAASNGAGGPGGGISAVGLSSFPGLSVTGSPITSSGSFTLSTSLSGIVLALSTGFTVATPNLHYSTPVHTHAITGDVYGVGSGTIPTTVLKISGVTATPFFLGLVDDVNATSGRATLGLGTIATQDAQSVNIYGIVDTSNGGFSLRDIGSENQIFVTIGSTATANRTITITPGDSDRTITLNGNASLSGTLFGYASGTNTGDQTVTTSGRILGRYDNGAGQVQEISIGNHLVLYSNVLDATGFLSADADHEPIMIRNMFGGPF